MRKAAVHQIVIQIEKLTSQNAEQTIDPNVRPRKNLVKSEQVTVIDVTVSGTMDEVKRGQTEKMNLNLVLVNLTTMLIGF